MPSFNIREAHEAVSESEARHGLFAHRVEGWSVWPIIRFQIARALCAVPFAARPSFSRSQLLRLAAADAARFAFVPAATYALLTYSSGLLDVKGDRFRDIWFDDIPEFASATFRIERLNSPRFADRRRKALFPSNVTSAFLDQWTGLLTRRKSPAELDRAAEEISGAVRRDFGIDDVSTEWVAVRLRYFHHAKRVFKSILRRLRPARAVVADFSEYAFVAAARELDIPTIELQHGINDRYHSGYVWGEAAKPFKSTMPVPDRMLLYGEYWRKEMDASGFWSGTLRVTGSPRLDRHRREATTERSNRLRVVVTGQGFSADRVARFLLETVRAVPNAEIIVKLHPVYGSDRAVYESVLRSYSAVTILDADEGPSTFALLARANLHVSISSASHYDAIGFGVPTVILGIGMSDVVEPLRQSGHALYAGTPADLADIVREGREQRVPDDVREYYFRSNAQQNISPELAGAGPP